MVNKIERVDSTKDLEPQTIEELEVADLQAQNMELKLYIEDLMNIINELYHAAEMTIETHNIDHDDFV